MQCGATHLQGTRLIVEGLLALKESGDGGPPYSFHGSLCSSLIDRLSILSPKPYWWVWGSLATCFRQTAGIHTPGRDTKCVGK